MLKQETVAGIDWSLTLYPPCKESFLQPNIRKLYLFLGPANVGSDGKPTPPDVFWSLDPSGSHRMSEVEAETWGIKPHMLSTRPHFISDCFHPWFQYIQPIYERLGFDANSDEVARLLGFPQMQPAVQSRLFQHIAHGKYLTSYNSHN